jgi:hypothetical protein
MFFGLNDVGFLGSLQPPAPPAPLLLDLYPNAAAAYSLRQLRTGVTNVVRVRRSSDNTEADFTAAQVSDGSLAAWVGAGNNGFVRTWYDQSGNSNHAIQSTTSIQPQIVDSGYLLATNAKPAVKWDATGNSNLIFDRITNIGTVFGVYKCDEPSAFNFLLGDLTSFHYHSSNTTLLQINTSLNAVYFGNNYVNSVLTDFGATARSTNQSIITMIHQSATAAASAISRDRTQSLRSWRGTIQELILYSSSLPDTRAAIEANINTHYAIY